MIGVGEKSSRSSKINVFLVPSNYRPSNKDLWCRPWRTQWKTSELVGLACIPNLVLGCPWDPKKFVESFANGLSHCSSNQWVGLCKKALPLRVVLAVGIVLYPTCKDMILWRPKVFECQVEILLFANLDRTADPNFRKLSALVGSFLWVWKSKHPKLKHQDKIDSLWPDYGQFL